MKRWTRIGLCLGVLTAALTCSALAATPDYTTDGAGTVTCTDGTYTASYANAISGNQYVILVVKGTVNQYSVSEDTIMYIDQKAAEGDTISFDFIPRNTPDCVVLLGGEFVDGLSPKVLGTLIGQGVEVSGSVTSYNPGNPTTVELYSAGTRTDPVASAAIAAMAGEGQVTQSFTLSSVPAGAIYDLKIHKAGHTDYWLTGISVEDALTLDVLKLVSGDVDGDGNVTSLDQNEILRGDTYNRLLENAAVPAADIDGDRLINSMDINTVLSSENYNKGTVITEYGTEGD